MRCRLKPGLQRVRCRLKPGLQQVTMHAEILAIGDEITSGQTLDTNSQWLSHGWRNWASPCATTRRSATNCGMHRDVSPGDRAGRRGRGHRRAGAHGRRSDAQGVGRRGRSPLQLDAEALEYIRGDVCPAAAADAAAERAPGDVSGRQPRGAQSARHGAGHRLGSAPAGRPAVPGDLSARRARRNDRNVARPRGRRPSADFAETIGGSSAAGGSTVSAPAKAKSNPCCRT